MIFYRYYSSYGGSMQAMYATIVYLSLFELLICGLGLILPKSITLTFLLPSGIIAIASIVFAAFLLHFSLLPRLRKARFKILFGIVGSILLACGSFGVIFPRYFDTLPDAMRAANLLSLFVNGINMLLASVEYERDGVDLKELAIFPDWVRRRLPAHTGMSNGEFKR